MRRTALLPIAAAAAAVIAAATAPTALAAQDAPPQVAMEAEIPPQGSDDMAALAGMFGDLPKPEPLTPEQQARLPAAERVIQRIMPDGVMAQMTDQIMGGVFGSLTELGGPDSRRIAAERLGMMAYELDALTDEQATELAGLLDPAWQERETRKAALFPEMMGEVAGLMEAPMRRAMAELYAIRFSAADLAAIDAFFSTETGTRYARESFTMTSDPRVAAVSLEVMPAMFGMIAGMEGRMQARMADLPEPRAFRALGARDRARVAALVGIPAEQIDAQLDAQVVEIPAVVPSPTLTMPPQTD